ncbi:restriction endonuclease S subunit [Methanomethylovorans hollandica DSM 15978]|uniref:Restriction endonuclease S subunit n=1 Tax=Methanomethylovorans hollandica (strain DSM 15978 / NBRC 107637 / DMS1) TaxID=867904 RepID=L0KZW6_METHD|nr:restriction endonuclease subunit S [Methanomethylovorans hollandica]AGB49539.1 restriction endonuclease S subunit [Methanomethylovorans hollandica DSM 15978]
MTGEWKETELGDILVEKGYIRGPFGSSLKRGEMKDSGVPVYEQKNAIYNSRDFRFFIDEDKFHELKRFQVRTNDLIISCSGTVGKISIIKEEDPKGIISQALLTLRVNTKKIELLYLYYFLSSRQGFALLTQASHGSVQINIAERKVVESIPLLLPPLPEQRAIASVLSSLDDKIDLLHRQNKTLEAMAETLFRQWFVEEADEGWEEGTLGDVIDLFYGKGLKNEIRTGTGYPVIGSSGIVGYHSEFLVEGPGIVIGRKGTLGKVIYLWDNFFPIDTTYYVKSKVESAGLLYEYFLLKTLSFEEMDSDSAVPGLNRNLALSTEIKIAPLDKLNQFNQFSSTFIDKLRKNTKQIHTLEKMRDTLLPKLMSGEVRVECEDVG